MNIQKGLEQFAPATDLELDSGIRHAVLALRVAGIETFESCEGGHGHAFPDPTIKFHGGAWAGQMSGHRSGQRSTALPLPFHLSPQKEWWRVRLKRRFR
ncbi:hypothetical protein ACVIGB_002869 [Bradyrhizobium sp. USDA 4341]|uniref:Uncharacterized protein n=1 Tax=Bradyrhizobium erythrophlei TaxID=1437360 RepID=A0A1H4T1R8_9BRAD|nr:hypothetical protein [Bradyrhizobium erythrophlei]SEC50423.1 hypothetical protein SAMN05444164_2001 [Bradyrhizobium erythrophlei]